jgi:hypothetical protein
VHVAQQHLELAQQGCASAGVQYRNEPSRIQKHATLLQQQASKVLQRQAKQLLQSLWAPGAWPDASASIYCDRVTHVHARNSMFPGLNKLKKEHNQVHVAKSVPSPVLNTGSAATSLDKCLNDSATLAI